MTVSKLMDFLKTYLVFAFGQSVNFFTLGSRLCLVDLPGYGFAYAKEEAKEAWEDLVSAFENSFGLSVWHPTIHVLSSVYLHHLCGEWRFL